MILAPFMNVRSSSRFRLELETVMSADKVTFESVPPMEVNWAPPAVETVPPLMMPMIRQEPVAAERASPPDNVPVRFTVPPLRTTVPMPA